LKSCVSVSRSGHTFSKTSRLLLSHPRLACRTSRLYRGGTSVDHFRERHYQIHGLCIFGNSLSSAEAPLAGLIKQVRSSSGLQRSVGLTSSSQPRVHGVSQDSYPMSPGLDDIGYLLVISSSLRDHQDPVPKRPPRVVSMLSW
jgi:hypothetical protein